jgi:hypothetical protein
MDLVKFYFYYSVKAFLITYFGFQLFKVHPLDDALLGPPTLKT